MNVPITNCLRPRRFLPQPGTRSRTLSRSRILPSRRPTSFQEANFLPEDQPPRRPTSFQKANFLPEGQLPSRRPTYTTAESVLPTAVFCFLDGCLFLFRELF